MVCTWHSFIFMLIVCIKISLKKVVCRMKSFLQRIWVFVAYYYFLFSGQSSWNQSMCKLPHLRCYERCQIYRLHIDDIYSIDLWVKVWSGSMPSAHITTLLQYCFWPDGGVLHCDTTCSSCTVMYYMLAPRLQLLCIYILICRLVNGVQITLVRITDVQTKPGKSWGANCLWLAWSSRDNFSVTLGFYHSSMSVHCKNCPLLFGWHLLSVYQSAWLHFEILRLYLILLLLQVFNVFFN